MAIEIGTIISTVVSSLITTVFAFFILRLLKEDRGFLRVFIVVLVANVVTIFLPYLSMLGISLPWFVSLIISIVVSLVIYKYGLDLLWTHTIILVVLTPVIVFAMSFVLGLLGLGDVLSLGFLT